LPLISGTVSKRFHILLNILAWDVELKVNPAKRVARVKKRAGGLSSVA
jgi:hypothetical protein